MSNETTGMIEAVAPDRIRQAYDFLSRFYGKVLPPLDRGPRMLGLERASIHPRDKVLEVAVGPGATLVEILRQVDSSNVVHGVDLSPRMVEKAQHRVQKAGFTNVDLRVTDARRLPFPDDAFDVLYCSYMLDMIPLDDMPVVLGEFKRVLRPRGRLVLVNLSKKDETKRTTTEWLYQRLPKRWVPYLLGGCRPVLVETRVGEAGFDDVRRDFIHHVIPSEIVTATKPTNTQLPTPVSDEQAS